LADPNTRQGKRTPVTLKIKFKSETLEQFIERYAVDVSQGGIFIRTKEPLAVGTQMKFEFQLRDASPLIAGEGTVVWTRENDPSRPAIAPGMGVRFDRLAEGSQAVLERILAEKAKQAPGRGPTGEATTKPPMFTDTPTRVAPAPVQEALGITSRRPRTDSEQTPLPPPRPFHSDADDFDEKAFEEATKVRSLDELAAQTAGLVGDSAPVPDPADDAAATAAVPDDELAARRGAATSSEPAQTSAAAAPTVPAPADRESAPGLPEPPRRPSTPTEKPSDKPVEEARTKLGLEPAKARTRADSVLPRAESALPPAPAKSSAASVVILLLVLVASGAAAVWWFVLREKAVEQVADVTDPDADTQVAIGSGGSAVMTGSDIMAGSDVGSAAVVPDEPAPTVDTVITASLPKGATVEVVGTDQKGASPFTAKLEQDKAYKARVTAPGYLVTEIDVTGGEKASAKLVAKPRVVRVTTEPAGADIYVDGVNTRKLTPSEFELTAAQAAKSRVRVSLRRPGYRTVEQTLDAKAFKDQDAQMTASINAKLAVVPKTTSGTGTQGTGATGTDAGIGSDAGTGTHTTGTGTTGTGTTGTGTTGTGTGTGTTGTGTGTGTGTPPGGGAGSAKPLTPPPSGGGAGGGAKPPTGSGAAPSSGGATPSASSGEPEPTWTR
jgi:uncharacterized protein (TIGR02266 family)